MAKKNESEAVKVAKIERQTQRERLLIQGLTAIVTNPVVAGIGGFWLVDRLAGAYEKRLDETAFAAQYGYHYTGGTLPVAAPTRKVWNPRGGILTSGTILAAQLGLTGYLGAEAVKSIGSGISSVVDMFTPG